MTDKFKKVISLSKKAYGQYAWQIVALLVISVIGGIVEVIGINALIPLFSFILGESQVELDAISQLIHDAFAHFGLKPNFTNLVFFICILFGIKAITLVVANYMRISISASYQRRERIKLYDRMLTASLPFLASRKMGHLSDTLLVDIAYGSGLFRTLANIFTTSISLIIYLFAAVNISLQITTITLVFMGVVALIIKPYYFRIRKLSEIAVKLNKDVTNNVSNSMVGMKTLKSMNAEKSAGRIIADIAKRQQFITLRTLMYSETPKALIEPLAVIFVLVIFSFYYNSPDFTLAAFAVIFYLITRIINFTQRIINASQKIFESIPHIQFALNLSDAAFENAEVESEHTSNFTFNEDIRFEKVCFTYPDKDQLLYDIDFIVKKGDMVGIIGPSGSGKTTLFDMLMKYIYPTQGNILVDGKSLHQINRGSLRHAIGYVSQESYLLNDTIRNNILFYDTKYSDEEVLKAVEQAYVTEFLGTLPKGLDTVVGERGAELSAGQKQRVALARVLLRKPDVLLLDEATSALDAVSEKYIHTVIESLRGLMTIVIIAHRLTTITNVDTLVVLKDGRIKEMGKPSELLKDKNSYFYKVNSIK